MTKAGPVPDPAIGAVVFDKRHVSLLWAVQAHAADIARLHASLFPEPWDVGSVLQLLAHPGSIALVAGHGNPSVVGGFALARIAADEAEVLTLGVTEGWRRHGIGQQLVAGIKRAAARGGAKALFLEVAASNAAARVLYGKEGFVEAARRPGYYKRHGVPAEDAIVLRCELAAG